MQIVANTPIKTTFVLGPAADPAKTGAVSRTNIPQVTSGTRSTRIDGVCLDVANGFIESMYSINNKPAVFDFLQQHEEVAHLAREAYFHLRKSFPAESFSLVLQRDPEEDDTALVGKIRVNRSISAKASEQMSAFESSWWLSNRCRGEGQLLFMLSFR